MRDNDKILALKALATGQTIDEVVITLNTTKAAILDAVTAHGYPRQTSMEKAAEILQRNLEATRAIPERAPDLTEVTRRRSEAAAAAHARQSGQKIADQLRATTSGQTAQIVERTGDSLDGETASGQATAEAMRLRTLINTAKGIDDKRIQRALDKALTALTALQAEVTTWTAAAEERKRETEAREKAAAEVARLERELAAAKAKLRGPGRKTRPSTGPASVDGTTIQAYPCRAGADDCQKPSHATPQGRATHERKAHDYHHTN